MKILETAVRIRKEKEDLVLIRIHPSIVRTANIKNGSLFEQFLTEDGILLRRADTEDDAKEDVGPTPARTSPTSARQMGGANH